MRVCILVLVVLVVSQISLAQDAAVDKIRAARAAAVAMVQPSGPLRLDNAASHTPEEWRARPRIVGTYSNYANRNTYILPFAPWAYGYGYSYGWGGSWGWGWGGGWYPLGGYSSGYSGW